MKKPKLFRQNLENNISDGPPSDKFLWPKYLTKENEYGTYSVTGRGYAKSKNGGSAIARYTAEVNEKLEVKSFEMGNLFQ